MLYLRKWTLSKAALVMVGLNFVRCGDPLREMGADMFCKDEPVMAPCDAKGSRVCAQVDDEDNKNAAKCMSVCTTLNQKTTGVVTEYFSQCACPPAVSNATDAGCNLCCMSPKTSCNKFSSIANAATSDLANRDTSFCYDECQWGWSGKSCMLTAAMSGICHRGKCRDQCELIGDYETCSGSDECKAMGASWCCKEKGKDNARCRVEDHWHKKFKKALEFNSPAVVLTPTLTLPAVLVPAILAIKPNFI